MVKNCDRGLKMLPEAVGRGQHFHAQGHSFSLYEPTLSRQMTYLFFSYERVASSGFTQLCYWIDRASTNHRKHLTSERASE